MNDTTDTPASTPNAASTSFHDTASLTAVPGFPPTGAMTYGLFATGDCTGAAISTHTVTLTSGTVPPSPSTPLLTSGTFSFHATYSGDANYASSVAACEPFTVASAAAPPPDNVAPAPVAPITESTVPVTG
jgi:hypothetical protein